MDATRSAVQRLVRVTPEAEEELASVFGELAAAGDELHFHPHPLDRAAAHAVAHHAGEDGYYLLVAEGAVAGYGMLRGWDDGYDVPSLGIALRPAARGRGLARLFMQLLHDEAAARGARSVRLTVYPDNEPALRLYRSLGYRFTPREDGTLVGTLELERKPCG